MVSSGDPLDRLLSATHQIRKHTHRTRRTSSADCFSQNESSHNPQIYVFSLNRFGNFHPKILAILKDQEEECERLAGSLYTKGLTQSQVGQVFDEIYGEHYSKTSISRMIEYVRRDVAEWLERGLDKYYPIVFVDCAHIKVFRKKRAATEAFYVILGVNEDATREVLGLYNSPIESASGWSNMFDDLRDRGVERCRTNSQSSY